ncbi:MAG: DnaJ domain-containing protein [Alphaproteobacteria bacterium]
MSQKPDFYQVLGVERTAGEADIKKAFMRITMTCHPDSAPYKKLNDEQKAEADVKFAYGKEAQTVLLDPVKRAAYDKFGHPGLDSIANGQQPQQSWSDAMGPVKKRVRTNEEVFDFFDRAAERNGTASKAETKTSDGPELSEEDMRRAAAEARRRNRGQSQPDIGSSAYVAPKPEPKPEVKPAPAAQKPAEKTTAKPTSIFEDVAEKVSEAAGRLRGAASDDVTLPAEVLEKFRDNLQDFIGEVDNAIRQSRRSGPKGGYNR